MQTTRRGDHAGGTRRGLAWIAGLLLASAVCYATTAPADEATTRQRLARWAGNDDTDALLREPRVRANLKALLGPQLAHLEHNLNVRGSVDVVGAVLSISGNAPHRGTEEEAVVCILPSTLAVEAAIYSRGTVTVYARTDRYEGLTLCIKDWITLVTSGHVNRLTQPNHVRMHRGS